MKSQKLNRRWWWLALPMALSACSSLPSFAPSALPSSVLLSDQGAWIVLTPSSARPKPVGLVFYPGGFVKPEAYLLALAPIAAAGYPVVVVRMPFDLAFFDAEKGLEARSALPSVARWVIGGHSLGGVASAIAVDKHPEAFEGIVFWASYPAEANSLRRLKLAALSISASNDGLSTPAKISAADGLLPEGTTRVTIEGGNHAQFADYGPQKGDGEATVSRSTQQATVAASVLVFLESL